MKKMHLLIGAGLLVLFGCEDIAEQEIQSVKKADLVADAPAETVAQTPTESGEDIPLSTLTIAISDMIGKQKFKSDHLTVVVTNSGKEDLWVKAQVNCSGLGSFQESTSLGEILVKAGDKKSFRIKAQDLPIQSDVNISQIRAQASFRSAERSDDDWSMILSPGYYYVLDEQYENATVMSEDIVMIEQGGAVLKETSPVDKGVLKIGKVKKNGVFENVTAGSDALAIRSEDGRILGRVVSETIDMGGDQAQMEGAAK